MYICPQHEDSLNSYITFACTFYQISELLQHKPEVLDLSVSPLPCKTFPSECSVYPWKCVARILHIYQAVAGNTCTDNWNYNVHLTLSLWLHHALPLVLVRTQVAYRLLPTLRDKRIRLCMISNIMFYDQWDVEKSNIVWHSFIQTESTWLQRSNSWSWCSFYTYSSKQWSWNVTESIQIETNVIIQL